MILGLAVAALTTFGVRSLEKRESEQRRDTYQARRRAEEAEGEIAAFRSSLCGPRKRSESAFPANCMMR